MELDEEARCLSVDEFELLLKAAKEARPHTRNYLPEFCILGFNTLMRPGEMLELEWGRVDFDNKVVALEVEHTKGKARRLVPLNDDACACPGRAPPNLIHIQTLIQKKLVTREFCSYSLKPTVRKVHPRP